ncbi:TolC family protein [Anditalea andensis]|uniref:TolC family protein n=1 Tax=Anditalea andensis TaxID=1048983 RepID=UPI00068D0743|nr:TolC family protein [Anditalea andensis]
MSRIDSENIFLRENLILLAEKLEIPKAEALLMQARLWPNPTFEVEEVNLWATENQLSVFGDELQGFNGGRFGRNQQFSFSIEQLILTAGKRKKSAALEQVNLDKSHSYFEDLLRTLKVEFRHTLTHLQFLQFSLRLYEDEISVLRQLTKAYQRQVDQGNVPKGEYIRLKALELEFARNINDLTKDINESQMELKTWMRLPANIHLVISDEDYPSVIRKIKGVTLEFLVNESKENRPDLKIAAYNQRFFSLLHTYERAQRIPDFSIKVGYDRGGNFMYNFVGFGIAMDLPVFNRNKGNIKYAKAGIEQSNILYSQKDLAIQNEISLAYQNLIASIQFYESIDPGYASTLDDLLKSYNKNFINRNISLLEFLDFLDAYLENKNIILQAGKEINHKAEELNYVIGSDILSIH